MAPRRRLLAAAMGAASVPAGALAQGAPRVELVAAVHIAASPARVWAVIGHFADLSWDRLVANTQAEGGDAPDATRTVTLKTGGLLMNEELLRYEPQNFTYATFLPHVDGHVLPVASYASILVVLPQPDGGSRVEWRSAFARGPRRGVNDAAVRAVTGMTQPALDGLKKRLEAEPPTN